MFKPLKKVLAVSLVLALGIAAAGCGTQAAAPQQSGQAKQENPKYPTKAVTVEQGFAPGGGSDQLVQLVAPYLQKDLGVQFNSIYKQGADGAICWKEVAHAKPDGYTITTLLTKTLLNAMINKDAGYTMADFKPVAQVVWDPGILVVAPNSKFQKFQDVIDYAKANPGKFTMTNSGTGGDDWYNVMLIQKYAGVTFNNVPYNGDSPSWQAVAGGNGDANSTNASVVMSLIKGGKLKALAVYSDKRLPTLPDVPTLKELGINFTEGSARGFMVPKDTPQYIVDILANSIEKAVNDPEFKKAADAGSLDIIFKKGADYEKALQEENDSMKQVIDQMGLAAK